ncbi:uncharacterized protein N7529_006979 [Penicillium soppii]|uniref:uncharacterized protein n=1 Tax=Penicillium soppii TaxID=69789 RepID=UPI002547526C|nr:uncharacterized protein N7529_006979 [Penicillium soppii]KAJ5865063.1 hypothetical protein N7529_006979 [Penicillium soppii]
MPASKGIWDHKKDKQLLIAIDDTKPGVDWSAVSKKMDCSYSALRNHLGRVRKELENEENEASPQKTNSKKAAPNKAAPKQTMTKASKVEKSDNEASAEESENE